MQRQQDSQLVVEQNRQVLARLEHLNLFQLGANYLQLVDRMAMAD